MPDRNASIYAVFKQVAHRDPGRTAVIYLGSRFTYGQLRTAAEGFARALNALGVKPGARVVIYLPNTVHWIVSWLGILCAGGICVPIIPIQMPQELAHVINDSGAETIVCTDTNFGYVQRVMAERGLERVIVARMTELLPVHKRLFDWLFGMAPRGNVAWGPRIHAFRSLVKTHGAGPLPEMETSPRSVAEILYTSGTTHSSRGVPITHAFFLASALEQVHVSDALIPSRENIVLGHSPLYHILGQTCGLATLLLGGTLLIQPHINIDATFDAISRFSVRTLIAVPSFYRMMLEHERLDQYQLDSVDYWFSAGDVLPRELNKRWEARFGKRIHQGYGCTETCGGVAMCPVNDPYPATCVGRVLGSKEVMIVDPVFLDPLPHGAPGELLVHSKNMVTAYLNAPEQTAQAFIQHNGKTWYRTGDVMSLDDSDYLYFIDRTLDTINHDGHPVSASEVEAVLQEHPAVVGSCVVGVPDPRFGERIKACVVLKADIRGITGYELIQWCRKRMLPYMVPQYVEFRDMLPKSKLGKVLRREVREEERQRAGVA